MPNFKGIRRQTTTARGYGADHKRARAAAFKRLPDWSPCCRCRRLMWKWAKDRHGRSTLHFDHTADRRSYLGFSCADCNRRAGAAAGGRAATQHPARTPTTRSWQSRNW